VGAATVRPSARSAAASALSAAAYSAQTLAAQYAWHRPRWKGNSLPRTCAHKHARYQNDKHGMGRHAQGLTPPETCSKSHSLAHVCKWGNKACLACFHAVLTKFHTLLRSTASSAYKIPASGKGSASILATKASA